MLLLQLLCQRLKYRAVKACLPVDISGCHLLADHGLPAPCIYRHVKSQALHYVQRVDLRFFKGLVSGYYCHT